MVITNIWSTCHVSIWFLTSTWLLIDLVCIRIDCRKPLYSVNSELTLVSWELIYSNVDHWTAWAYSPLDRGIPIETGWKNITGGLIDQRDFQHWCTAVQQGQSECHLATHDGTIPSDIVTPAAHGCRHIACVWTASSNVLLYSRFSTVTTLTCRLFWKYCKEKLLILLQWLASIGDSIGHVYLLVIT